jgi:Spy/CpxP family protein refolding chaperone
MSPTSRRGWLAVLLLVAMTASVRAQSFGFPWWRDAQFQKDLSLTSDQSARIDSVFQSTISLLRQKRQELDQQEAELSRLIAANADEATVVKQVDKVEGIRASLNKHRTLMLLRMRQVLSPDQRVKLNKLYEDRQKDQKDKATDKKRPDNKQGSEE